MWLKTSGAAREMENNPGYYSSLLEYSINIPCPSEHQIDLDLKRTFPNEKKCMEESFLQSMKNILLCYSTRNTTVGYCQGMNFLVARLLLFMEDEEKVFWLFTQIIEKILSLFNYQELTGVIIETTLIETLISYYLPELNKFLIEKDFAITMSNFIHKWIVCLFAQTLKPEMVNTLYDFFFVDGFITMIKNCIFVLTSIQQEVLSKENFGEIYAIFMDLENKVTKPKNMIFFLCQKKFRLNKQDILKYRKYLQVPIINKIKEGELTNSVRRTAQEKKALLKKKNINCNPNWPFCLYEPSLFDLKEVLIIKENKTPYIIDDYYYIKHKGYPNNMNDLIDGVFETDKTANTEILIERHKHICDDQKIVDVSQNFGKLENVYHVENVDKSKDKSQDMKIYELVKKSKDVDAVVKFIKENLKKKEEKIVLRNEIDIINEKNKDYIYYTNSYYKKDEQKKRNDK